MTAAFCLYVDATIRPNRKAAPAFHVDVFMDRVERAADEPGTGEPAVAAPTIERLAELASQIHAPARLRSADVSTFYGEIDVNWACGEKQITLMVFPDGRGAQIHWYQRRNGAEAAYDMVDANADTMNERLDWLYA